MRNRVGPDRARRAAGWALLVLFGVLLSATPACRKAPGITAAPPTAAEPARMEPHIRVLLREGLRHCEVLGERRADVLRLDVEGSQVILSVHGQERDEVIGRATGFRLVPRRSWLYVDQKAYRGVVDVFINPLGEPVVVNDLSLEDYLRSVVPGELGPKQYPELEALKAQSVAARTFAVSTLGENADRGFDVYSDVRSQVYRGVMSEQALSNRAVEETRGLVATYNGAPIVSMYCSTCGGVTESFDAVFRGGPIPYLKGGAQCKDGESSYHQWDETIDLSRRSAELARYVGVGRLTDLKTLDVSAHGRVVTMRFTGERGERTLHGNDVRFALGLRSNWIESLKIEKDADGFIRKIRVRGRGWGHGVGLCQIGAVELAERGKSFSEILKHYYDGIQLTSWYAVGRSSGDSGSPLPTSDE